MRAPPVAGWLVRRMRELADAPAARRARRARADVPLPPRRLRARTGAPGIAEFIDGGREAASELAAGAGRRLDAYQAILDFGCGSARVLPWIASMAPGAGRTGTDIDPAAIAWATAHHPQLGFSVCSFEPPLPFEAGRFDLVYSISVFSHLDEQLQDRWLAELVRVLRPGGSALLSVHGPYAFEQFRSGAVRTAWCPPRAFERSPLGAGEFLFEPYRRTFWNRGELPGVGASYGLAFHGEEYIRAHWGDSFEVLDVIPRAITAWQDLVVAIKRG